MSRQISRLPSFVQATGLGVCAYLVGYVVTYLWMGEYSQSVATKVAVQFRPQYQSAAGTETSLAFLLVDGGVADTTWAGWLFFNAHLVPIITGNFPFSAGTLVPNILLAAPTPQYLFLFAVPPITLSLAGALLARHTTRGQTIISPSLGLRLPNSAVRGASIAMGYVPCVLVGALVFSASTADARVAALAPDLFLSVLVAGLIYPMVFGALGGWISMRRSRSTRVP